MPDYLSKTEVNEIVGAKITGVKQNGSAIVELDLDNRKSVVINFYPECSSIYVSDPAATGNPRIKRKKKSVRR